MAVKKFKGVLFFEGLDLGLDSSSLAPGAIVPGVAVDLSFAAAGITSFMVGLETDASRVAVLARFLRLDRVTPFGDWFQIAELSGSGVRTYSEILEGDPRSEGLIVWPHAQFALRNDGTAPGVGTLFVALAAGSTL